MASEIQQAHSAMTWVLVEISAAAKAATSHDGVVSPGSGLTRVQGGGERETSWVIFVVGDAISVDVQWRTNGVRCKVLTASRADAISRG